MYQTNLAFNCYCKDKHEYFVLTCKQHLFISNDIVGMNYDNCSCKFSGPHDVCSFCVWLRYIINCCVTKICIEKTPENI